ncbi:MXAN_6640 family putative metalloprotease [Nocardioides sp. YIM 152588]|uniref:MXAN_6640 family putative metalloprotease n=1 Tax=Nocardioides sp. YIM 152588 TaxID=3158259 RepID=UPI0032E4E194
MRLRRTALGGLILALSGTLAFAPVGPAATADPTAPVAPTLPEQAAEQAQEHALEALETVQEILDGDGEGPEDEPAELTIALHDLAAQAAALPAAEREQAQRLLARPTDTTGPATCDHEYACYDASATQYYECSDQVCVHWVTTTADRVPAEDDGPGGNFSGEVNGIPDYVDTVLREMDHVAGAYTGAGYRPVLSDDGRGADGMTATEADLPDIYLAQLVSATLALYGYCTTDDPDVIDGDPYGDLHLRTWAYCVLDNNYTDAIFNRRTPLENLQVTAAHEYFHAVQYGYDVDEDSWILEATATWAEDQLYDDVNDNIAYLPYGPIRHPQTPLDTFNGSYAYGAWIFFQYLTDRFPAQHGGMPVLLRELWESMAHSGAGAKSRYSVQAIRKALEARGTDMTEVFTDFVVANRRARASYSDEGAQKYYPVAPLYKRIKPTAAHPKSATTFKLNHLAARTLRFKPASKGQRRLKLVVKGNPPAIGGSAAVVIKRAGKSPQRVRLTLNSEGRRVKRLPFTKGEVKWIEVSMVNASTRYWCDLGRGWNYTCQGKPRDNKAPQKVRATLIR